jgi:hypothetical protein
VNVGVALVTDSQPAVRREPRQCPLDHPPASSQSAAGVFAPPGDADLYPSSVECPTAEREVVTLIRVQLLRSLPRSTSATFDRRDRVKQLLEHLAVVDVGTGNQHREREARRVGEQVALGTGLASIGGIRAD